MDSSQRYERLRERYLNGGLSRRGFLGLLGAAGLAYGVQTPFSRMAFAETQQVRFDGWGGIVSEAFRKYAFDPYTEKTGIKVVDGTFGGADEYLSRVKASQNGEYNLAHLSGVFDYARYHSLGLSSELNEANIPNLKYVIPKLADVFRKVSDGKLSAVPYDYGTTGIAYNRKHISDEEAKKQGAKLLINPDLKGKLGGWSDWRTRIWYASLQTGQDPNDAQDMDKIWEALRTHRDLLLKYWSSGAELDASLLAEEEIYATEARRDAFMPCVNRGMTLAILTPPMGLAGRNACLS
ncbi:MAG: extracellular solute-binding protein [Thiolinea sp.]